MSNDKIVAWRPRSEVPRAFESFISQPPALSILETVAVRIDPTVHVGRLIRGLASVGIVFKHDIRTRTLVIMPRDESQPAGSDEEEAS
jgi:hypothetical protein